MNFNECSSICVHKGKPEDFDGVMEKLTDIDLPILVHYKDDAYHFVYDGVCDGNTAEALDMVIHGLIKLYKV